MVQTTTGARDGDRLDAQRDLAPRAPAEAIAGRYAVTIMLVFVPIGAVMIAVGLAFTRGPVSPALWYGGRAPRTQRARQAGYLANRRLGRTMLIGGGVVVAAAIAAWLAGATLDDEFVALSLVAAVVVSFVVAVVRALTVVRAP
jgi:uncharacterized membrane protein